MGTRAGGGRRAASAATPPESHKGVPARPAAGAAGKANWQWLPPSLCPSLRPSLPPFLRPSLLWTTPSPSPPRAPISCSPVSTASIPPARDAWAPLTPPTLTALPWTPPASRACSAAQPAGHVGPTRPFTLLLTPLSPGPWTWPPPAPPPSVGSLRAGPSTAHSWKAACWTPRVSTPHFWARLL